MLTASPQVGGSKYLSVQPMDQVLRQTKWEGEGGKNSNNTGVLRTYN